MVTYLPRPRTLTAYPGLTRVPTCYTDDARPTQTRAAQAFWMRVQASVSASVEVA